MKNILIRTGGGKAIEKELGLGHIYRVINLAKELKNCKIYFSLEDFGGAREILQNNGFNKIETIVNEIKTEQDLKKTELQIKKWKIDIVVVDRYKISKSYIRKLSKLTKVVVISDLFEINFKADLVINGFIGFKNQIIKNKLDTKCMIGPHFQILNKKFSKIKKMNLEKWDILITFGGYDEKNINEIMLEVIPDYLNKLKIKIILGPVAKKNNKLNSLEKKYSKNLKIIKSTNNMAKEMSNTKYGLCTGGLTTYEFSSMKIPIGIICDDSHQVITAREWQKIGFGKNLGLINKKSERKIRKFINEIYNRGEITHKRKRIVDGLGSRRAANEILKMKGKY